jgi:circadian clock protein KaiB
MIDRHRQQSFKGIALCTPGGDIAYAIDRTRIQHWHVQLCEALQQALNLSEAPYFLMPHGSATLDCVVSETGSRWFAEAGPIALRYRSVLDTLFDAPNCIWHPLALDVVTVPIAFDYHERFPELWHTNDLVIAVTPPETVPETPRLNETGYVLELFVRSDSAEMAIMLRGLHDLLERALDGPYSLKVIDVSKSPELTEARRIMATPTLLRIWPEPTRRLVGILDCPDRLRELLT